MTLLTFQQIEEKLLCFSNIVSSFICQLYKSTFLKQYNKRNKSLSEISTVTCCYSLGQDGQNGNQRETQAAVLQEYIRTKDLAYCVRSSICQFSTFAVGKTKLEDTLCQALSLAHFHHIIINKCNRNIRGGTPEKMKNYILVVVQYNSIYTHNYVV